jgi:hypothetical protein
MPKRIGSPHSHDIKPSLLDDHDKDHDHDRDRDNDNEDDDIKPTTSPSPSPKKKRLNPSSSSSSSSPTKKHKPNPNTANRLSADHKRTLMEMAMDKFLECADYDDMARKVGCVCVFFFPLG